MTSVNVTKTTNTVEVTDAATTTTVEVPVTSVVTATTAGPQGPVFASSGTTLTDTNRVNKSIIYYDSASGSYKADSTWTASTLTDGGNF